MLAAVIFSCPVEKTHTVVEDNEVKERERESEMPGSVKAQPHYFPPVYR